MAHILILEDQKLYIDGLALRIGRISIDLVTNSQDFRGYVDEGNTPELWFLDDMVPDRPYMAGGEFPCFIQNCGYLLERAPDAKVYYTGKFPEQDARDYAKQHSIKLIEKDDIGKIVQQELLKVYPLVARKSTNK